MRGSLFMKFKFRADKDDVLIFAIFAVFLFFVVSLVVSNIASVFRTGYLSGINILPVFTYGLFVPTFVFYLIILAAMFFSVNSYFFDREKGFGITTEKKIKVILDGLKIKKFKLKKM